MTKNTDTPATLGNAVLPGTQQRDPLIDEIGRDVFVRKWNEALDQCHVQLSPSHRQAIQNFSDPDDLIKDLRQKAEILKSDMQEGFIALTDLESGLATISKGLVLLRLAMQPDSIETSLLWGLLYLPLERARDVTSTTTFTNTFTDALTRTARALKRCLICKDDTTSEEFKENLMAVFIALIKFWASTSTWMHENRRSLDTTTDYFRKEFENTMKEIEHATYTIERCFSSRVAGKGRHQDVSAIDVAIGKLEIDSMGIKFPHKDLPLENAEHFVGRTDIMGQMHQILRPNGEEKPQHCCLWGLGGMGKSQTALRYANSSFPDNTWDALFWIRAASEESLDISFSRVATKLGLKKTGDGASPHEIRDSVHHWLEASRKKWLMIFDNVDDLSLVWKYMPTSSGSILITTRFRRVAENVRLSPRNKIHIEALTPLESWSLFSGILKERHDAWKQENFVLSDENEECKAGKELCRKLGGLPLGIRQVAALICQKQSMAVMRFCKLFDKRAGDFQKLSGTGGDSSEDPDFSYTVQTVWNLSFQRLADSDAAKLLATMCFLFPDEIPMDLFKYHCDELAFSGDEDLLEFDEPKQGLINAALIDADKSNLSIHRLVQSAFLHYPNQEQSRDRRTIAFKAACRLLNEAFPKQVSGRPLVPRWTQCLRYATHVKWLADRYVNFQPSLSPNSDFLEVISNCSWYLLEIGETSNSAQLVNIAKEACKDKSSLIYSHLENTLGSSHFELGNLVAAKECFEASLKIRRKELHHEDEDLLCTIHNYANVLNSMGGYSAALDMYEENRRITVGMREDEETKVGLALTYSGIGRARLQMHELDKAEAAFIKALDLVVSEYGPRGHYVAHMLYYIGNVDLARGDTEKAFNRFTESLEIYREQNPIHQLTACLYYKLGVVEILRNHDIEARACLEKALAISQETHWEGNVARIARKLAPLLYKQNGPDDSVTQRWSAMAAIWERRLEEEGKKWVNEDEKDEAFNTLVCIYFW